MRPRGHQHATFVGAPQHTNNTGELTGLIEAIIWLLDEDPEPERAVLLRPDSEYAIGIAVGDIDPQHNRAMAKYLRNLMHRLRTQRRGKITWAHVPSHTRHKWNDRADELAAKGAKLTLRTSEVPGARWARVRLDGPLSPHRTAQARRARMSISVSLRAGCMSIVVSTTTNGECVWRIPAGQTPCVAAHLSVTHAAR